MYVVSKKTLVHLTFSLVYKYEHVHMVWIFKDELDKTTSDCKSQYMYM